MKYLFAASILLHTFVVYSQESFSRIYGLEREFIMTNFANIEFENDTLLLFGSAIPISQPQTYRQSVFFAKADTFGNLLEHHFYPDPEGGSFTTGRNAPSLLKTSDGGYAIIGTDLFSDKACFVKLNHEMELTYYRKYDPSPNLQFALIKAIEVRDGYLLAGRKTLNQTVDGFYNANAFLMKIDKSGNILWEKDYGEREYFENFVSLVSISSNHIVMGNSQSPPLRQPYNSDTFNRTYFIHVDSLGNVLQEQISTPNNLRTGPVTLAPMLDGWMYGTAKLSVTGPTSLETNMKIVRTGHDINDLKWELEIPNTYNITDFLVDMKPTHDGHWVATSNMVIGRFLPPDPMISYQAVTTFKFTEHGEMLWLRSDTILSQPMYGSAENYAGGLAIDSLSGSIYLAAFGNSYGYNPVRSYAWLLKITPDGCIDTLCAMITSSTAPNPSQDYASNSLFVYPNPTTGPISWRATNDLLPPPNIASAEVLTCSGAGSYTCEPRVGLDLSALPVGLYRLVFRDDAGRVVLAQGVGRM